MANYIKEWNTGVRKRRKGIAKYEKQRKRELSDVRRILKRGR